MKTLKLAVVLVVTALCAQAQATVLTFDDVTTAERARLIGTNYGGLSWFFGFQILDGSSISNSGYNNGTVSGEYVAYNSSARSVSVTNYGSLFDFNGGYFTSAWRDNLNITIEGFLLGASTYSRTITVSSTSPTYFNLNFLDIDRLNFSSFGGTETPGFSGRGAHFVLDNFTYNETVSVPEPTSMALLGLGLAGVGFARKKKAE